MLKMRNFLRNNWYVCIFVIAALLLIICTSGCSDNPMYKSIDTTEPTEDSRFIINNGYETVAITDYSILTDTETGVQYLMFKNDVGKYATGYMSVLMNPDGTPIVTIE